MNNPIYNDVQNLLQSQDGSQQKWGGAVTKKGDRLEWKGQDGTVRAINSSSTPEHVKNFLNDIGARGDMRDRYGKVAYGSLGQNYSPDLQQYTQSNYKTQMQPDQPVGTGLNLQPGASPNTPKPYTPYVPEQPGVDPNTTHHIVGPGGIDPRLSGQPGADPNTPGYIDGPGGTGTQQPGVEPKKFERTGPGGIDPKWNTPSDPYVPPVEQPGVDPNTTHHIVGPGGENPGPLQNNQPGTNPNTPGYIDGPGGENPGANIPGSNINQVGPTTTVADRLNGLLSKENPYIKMARTRAQQQANSRGLLNSSIAAGVGEGAAIQAALPIAQQDAQTENQFALNRQGYQQDLGLLGAETGSKMQLAEQADYFNRRMLEKTTEAQRLLERDNHQYAMELADFNNQFDKEMTNAKLSSTETIKIGSAVAVMGETLSNQIATIQADPSLDADAKTAIIGDLKDTYMGNVSSLMAIYGVPITWDLEA